MDVSFVIPACDAAATIGATISSIREQVSGDLVYEVVVVDNRSSDDTYVIATKAGAHVFASTSNTISAVRNAGVTEAKGEYIVFLDADVTLENGWRDEFLIAASELRAHRFAFSGSRCSIPRDATWLERAWIAPRVERSMKYLGTGHFIIRRDDFLAVGGFDETKHTGEDVALSRSLLQRGGRIVPMPAKVACHHGNPRTLWEFARRESWHGLGDCTSVGAVASSRVARVAIVVGLLQILFIWGVGTADGILAATAAAGVLSICAASSLVTYRGAPITVGVINTFIYYVYYLARLSSFVRIAFPQLRRTWKRDRPSSSVHAAFRKS